MATTIKQQQAIVVTPEELETLRRPLLKSWTKAAGLLRHKRKALERHLKKIRLEWNRASS